jgi:hypothetical protein
MSFGRGSSLSKHESNKPWSRRRAAHDRVVPSGNTARGPPDARRPAFAEPVDVLADDPERRWKPARDERGGLWHADSCWFQTGEGTRKAKNVARDQRCAISVATKGYDVKVAGEARRMTDPKIVAKLATLWAKSGWPAQPDDSGTSITAPFNAPTLGPPPWFVYEVRPRTATAVGTAAETPGSTRWRF